MAATSTAKSSSKKVGKENAPPPKSSKAVEINDDDEDDVMNGVSEDEVTKSNKVGKSSKPAPTSKSTAKPSRPEEEEASGSRSNGSAGDAAKRLATMTAERDRYRSQRDTYVKQFDELSKLRNTESEKLFEKFKAKAEQQAKAQNDLIANMTALNENLQAKIAGMEKANKSLPGAGGPFEDGKNKVVDPKELKALKEEVAKLQVESKKKDERYASLEKELQAEIGHSQKLQAQAKSSQQPAIAASNNTEEAEKDAMTVRFYEDVTDLSIVNVKIKVTKAGKDVTYNCVQTVDGRSVSYKLRSYNELNTDPAEKKTKPWVKMLHYIPENMDLETDQDLLGRLGIYKNEFVVPYEQVGGLYEALRARISKYATYEKLEGE